MVEVTYSMLAWTAVLLFQAIVQYFVRSDSKKQHNEEPAKEPQPPLLQHDRVQQLHQPQDGNVESSSVSLSGRESDDCHEHHQHQQQPVSPASVFYVSFDHDGCENVKDNKKKTSSASSSESDCGLRYRQENPFNLPPEYLNSSSTNSSDESEESLEANEPKDFHKLLSQTGSEMMKSCLSIEDMVQEQINHE